MDKYERRRLALKSLVDRFGKGGIALVAGKIGKSPSYVSRMLYPDGKEGRKRIGEDSVDVLNKEYPDWCSDLTIDGAGSNDSEEAISIGSVNITTFSPKRSSDHPLIAEAVAILESTDEEGKKLALAGIRVALSGHYPQANKKGAA